MKRRALPIALFLLALIPGGCGGDTPPASGPGERFIDYYAKEVVLTEKTRLENGDSTLLRARLDSLGESYGMTRSERDSIIGWCRDSLPRWEAFLREVMARLDSTAGRRVTTAPPFPAEDPDEGPDGGNEENPG